jgi:hypothetical protein
VSKWGSIVRRKILWWLFVDSILMYIYWWYFMPMTGLMFGLVKHCTNADIWPNCTLADAKSEDE